MTKWRTNQGGYQTSFKLIDELVNRPGISPNIADAIKAAHATTDDVAGKMETLIAGIPYADKAPMSVGEFNKMCNSPFDSIIAVATAALKEATDHATARKNGALWTLGAAGIAFLIAWGSRCWRSGRC